jgi:hypothetical protein
MSTKPPPKPKAKAPKPASPKATKPGSSTASRPTKSFSVDAWDASDHGEKIILYGKSGIGKTTIAGLSEDPVFIGLDDGGRKIVDSDGKPLACVSGVESVYDLRDALSQKGLFDGYKTIVIDNLTKLQEVAEPYVVDNFKTSKGGKASTFRGFGWDGPAHMVDVFRLILSDLDRLVAQGKTIVCLAQLGDKQVANAGGHDYLEEGPALLHQRHASVRDLVCQWADHVLRLGYLDMQVEMVEGSKVGKVSAGDATRAVFCGDAQHFIAKSRPIKGLHLPAVISFEDPTDDTLWRGIEDPTIFVDD